MKGKMMKKIKKIIYLILLYIFIYMQYISSLNWIVVFVKHFSIFLGLALISYDVVTAITKTIITKHRLKGVLETIAYIFRVTTFAVLIINISLIQIDYIKFQDVPYTRGCKYYDNYNNLIYQSEYALNCPDLNIVTNNDHTLTFNVTETKTENDFDKFIIDENNYIDNNPVMNIETLKSISFHYDESNRIDLISYQISTLTQVTAEGYDDYQSYNSFHQIIKNEYDDSSFNQFVSTVSRRFDQFLSSKLTHYTFDEIDYNHKHYYTVVDTKTPDNVMYHLVKDYTEDDELKSKIIASIDYTIPDDKVFHYSIKVNKKEHDTIDQRTIDIVLRENDITYSIKEHSTYTYKYIDQFDIIYKQYSDYNRLISSNQNDNYKDGVNINHHTNTYSFVSNVDGNDYLISKSKRGKNSLILSSNEDKNIYLIQSTSYGKRVVYKYLRSQTYFNYLTNGKYKLENKENYFNYSQNSKYLFDLEYQIENTTQSDHLFFNEMPYLHFHK